VTAGGTMTVNVVAVDTGGRAINLTSSLPTYATLNPPTTGTGTVSTTITITPGTGDVGGFDASVTATAGEQSATEAFHITVAAAETDRPPVVTAPATVTGTEGSLLSFTVTASDPDQDAITSLTAPDAPTGSAFTANGSFTEGTFSWTPDLTQAGEYDVTFVASNALSDSATTHLSVAQSNLGPVTLAPIPDVTLAEGETDTLDVIASDPDKEAISLTASLPSFATLDAPTSSADQETLRTTITVKPGTGTAGTYQAWVTATSGESAATDSFSITVTAAAESTLAAKATLIGNFNRHKKHTCFKVTAVDSSFDLQDVDLSTLTLNYHGNSIPAVRAQLAVECIGGGDDGDGHDGDHHGDGDGDHHGDGDNHGGGHGDDQGENEHGNGGGNGNGDGNGNGHGNGHDKHGKHGHAAMLAATGHGGDDDCDDCDDDEDDSGGGNCGDQNCVASHVKACFTTCAIDTLFGSACLPAAFADATIEGKLTTGETFVARFGDAADSTGGGTDSTDVTHQTLTQARGKGTMHLEVRPNPMNPKTDIRFVMSQPGQVRVAIFDIRGRLVTTLQNGAFAAGTHSVPWDGATSNGHAASGIYYIKVQTPQETQVQTVTVVK